jgi:hypothetical protein
MITRRSFISLLGLLPFVRVSKAKAVPREQAMTESFNIAYGRRAGMSYKAAEEVLRWPALNQFLEERYRDFGYYDEAAWPGWTPEERKIRLDVLSPNEDRARWALWNEWYAKGNTEPMRHMPFVGLNVPELRQLRAYVEKMTRIEGSKDVWEPTWGGWSLEMRLAQVISMDGHIKNNVPCPEPHDWKYLRSRWLEPYKWHGMFFTPNHDVRYLELPRDRYAAFYNDLQDPIVEPVIDLHREFPITVLKF